MSTTFASVNVQSEQLTAVPSLHLKLLDSYSAARGGYPLSGNPYNGLAFTVDGVPVVVQSDDIYYALTYPALFSAFQDAVAAVPALSRVSVKLGPSFSVFDSTGILVSGSEIVLSSLAYDSIGLTSSSGWLSNVGTTGFGEVFASYQTGYSIKGVGAQRFTGSSINETIVGGLGDDVIDGGGGFDTAEFSGPYSNYLINFNVSTGETTVRDRAPGVLGTDLLINVERLQFADNAFDLQNLPRTETPAFGKSDSFLFDAVYYLLEHPYLVPTVTLATALDHYKSAVGSMMNTASPTAWFDPAYYASKWPDLAALNLDAGTLFAHYNLYGVWEGRSAGPAFDDYDGARYLRENPDVAAYVDANVKDFLYSRSNGAIAHYVIYGADEGRVAYAYDGAAIDLTILVGV